MWCNTIRNWFANYDPNIGINKITPNNTIPNSPPAITAKAVLKIIAENTSPIKIGTNIWIIICKPISYCVAPHSRDCAMLGALLLYCVIGSIISIHHFNLLSKRYKIKIK